MPIPHLIPGDKRVDHRVYPECLDTRHCRSLGETVLFKSLAVKQWALRSFPITLQQITTKLGIWNHPVLWFRQVGQKSRHSMAVFLAPGQHKAEIQGLARLGSHLSLRVLFQDCKLVGRIKLLVTSRRNSQVLAAWWPLPECDSCFYSQGQKESVSLIVHLFKRAHLIKPGPPRVFSL